MSDNIARFNALLSVGIDKSSQAAVRQALQNTMGEAAKDAASKFDEMMSLLTRAILKGDPGAVLASNIEKGLRQAASGRMSEALADKFKSYAREAATMGDTIARTIAVKAEAVVRGSLPGNSTNQYNGIRADQANPSIGMLPAEVQLVTQSLAEFRRKLQQETAQMVESNRVKDNLRHNADQEVRRLSYKAYEGETDQRSELARKYDDMNRGTTPAQRREDDARRKAYESANDARRDEILYGEGDRYRQHSKKRLDSASNLDRILRTGDEDAEYMMAPMTAEEKSKYSRMSRAQQLRFDARRHHEAGLGRDLEGERRGRFAAQNIGFGIDDAIQSYHYGGIGASIRAGSNNLTAIAGMTIANPAVAAATVVGLSVATAALPSILKSFGVDEEKQKARDERISKSYDKLLFSSNGRTHGGASRGTLGGSDIKNRISEYMDVTDQMFADKRTADNAFIYLKSKGFAEGVADTRFDAKEMAASHRTLREQELDHLPNDHPEKMKAAEEGNRERIKIRKTIEWVQQNGENQVFAQDAATRANLHMEMAMGMLPQSLAYQEKQNVVGRQTDIRLYQATSIEEYEQALRDKHATLRQNIRNRYAGKGLDHERDALLMQTSVDLHTSLANRYDNTELVQQNTFNRKWSLDEQIRSNMGYGGLGSILANSVKRQEGYLLDKKLTDNERDQLLSSNSKGVAYARQMFVKQMMDTNSINTSAGSINQQYATAAMQLQHEFDSGGYSEIEKAQLTKGMKQKYIKDMRDALTPSGTEQFISNASMVGGAEDRALEARMLGRFTKNDPIDMEALMKASLDQFIQMNIALGHIEEALALEKLGIPK